MACSRSRLAQYAGANASYFLPDGLGSVRQLADNGGTVTLGRRYDPFGDALSSAGSGASIFGFAGEQTDGTGLEYLRARYYAPAQGRLPNGTIDRHFPLSIRRSIDLAAA